MVWYGAGIRTYEDGVGKGLGIGLGLEIGMGLESGKGLNLARFGDEDSRMGVERCMHMVLGRVVLRLGTHTSMA